MASGRPTRQRWGGVDASSCRGVGLRAVRPTGSTACAHLCRWARRGGRWPPAHHRVPPTAAGAEIFACSLLVAYFEVEIGWIPPYSNTATCTWETFPSYFRPDACADQTRQLLPHQRAGPVSWRRPLMYTEFRDRRRCGASSRACRVAVLRVAHRHDPAWHLQVRAPRRGSAPGRARPATRHTRAWRRSRCTGRTRRADC